MKLQEAVEHLTVLLKEKASAVVSIDNRIHMIKREGVDDDLDRAYLDRLTERYARTSKDAEALTVIIQHHDPKDEAE